MAPGALAAARCSCGSLRRRSSVAGLVVLRHRHLPGRPGRRRRAASAARHAAINQARIGLRIARSVAARRRRRAVRRGRRCPARNPGRTSPPAAPAPACSASPPRLGPGLAPERPDVGARDPGGRCAWSCRRTTSPRSTPRWRCGGLAHTVRGLIVGEPVQTADRQLRAVLPVPAHRRAADDRAGAAHGAARRARAGAARPRHRAARHPAGRAPGARRRRPPPTGWPTATCPSASPCAAPTTSPGSGRSFNDMADSLQRQIRRLEDLSRLQRRFTSDVSHELRTPLTTIRMAAEFLHASRGDFAAGARPRRRAAARPSSTASSRCSADLLEISRYDAGVGRARVRDRPTSARWSPQTVRGHPDARRAPRQ